MKRFGAILLIMILLCSLTPVVSEQEWGEATLAGRLEWSGDETEGELTDAQEPYAPDTLEKKVIGHDDRIAVNPREYPYCAVAYLEASAPCGCSWTGSGFMVGPSGLVTAGHCLYCAEHDRCIDKLVLYFGYTSNKNYTYKYTDGTDYWYCYSKNAGSDTIDYGYVKLRQRVGDRVGWFGMTALSDYEITGWYNLAGYRNGVLKKDYDRTEPVNAHEISHTMDTEGGYSGCPIFNDANYVIGINVSHSNTYEKNYGCRVTWEMIRNMREKGIFD